ncbi:zinc-binding alcohol dehydrogenase family protein [Streptomyces sp. NPDC048436]|uniref:quinone oxidoreductase family protein n=1 Tax=Streptomyces sp. NPDC048436 TaxID=3365550 RepID=UPI00371B4FE5
MRAIQFDRFGGPEVLGVVEAPEPVPGPGQLLIQVEAAGVNFADTHQTDGSYLAADQLPYIPGSEVVGRTHDGRRVLAKVRGGYAELAVAQETAVFDIPEDMPAAHALALVMQGVTAWHLLRRAARLSAGESVLVHSAAGGVGSLAVQLAREFGAGRVLAMASTRQKREFALKLGADAAVSYPLDEPVDVILDGTGGPLFDQALDSLADFGRIVTYGSASRTSFTPLDDARMRSLNAAVVGFWLRPTLARPGAFTEPLRELLEMTSQGRLHPVAGPEYALADAGRAHRDLLDRRTSGKLTLLP